MRTLVKEITAYRYSELEEYARKQAKENYLSKAHLPDFFSADVTAELSWQFGLSNLKPLYSLFCCQGDGLCLYGRIERSELFDNDKFREIAFKGIHHRQRQSVYDELLQIDFTQHSHSRYNYAETVFIDCDTNNATGKQEAIIEKIIENVKTWYLSFCKEWETRGYDYFYEISDSDMQEICEEEKYLFTKNGYLIDQDEYTELTTAI